MIPACPAAKKNKTVIPMNKTTLLLAMKTTKNKLMFLDPAKLTKLKMAKTNEMTLKKRKFLRLKIMIQTLLKMK